MYAEILLELQAQKHTQETKRESSEVSDSGCTYKFNGSICPHKQCATNNNYYQFKMSK